MNTDKQIENNISVELEQLRRRVSELEEYKKSSRAIEEEFRQYQDKYEFIVNAHSEFMSLINKDYIYEAVNDAYCLAMRKRRSDFIGNSVSQLWGKDNFKSNIKPLIDRCLKGEIIKQEASFVFSGGKEKYYSVSYYPYKNDQNEITHVVVMTDDITERKLAEIALIESENHLRELNKKKDEYLSIIKSDLERASSYVMSLIPKPICNGPIKTYWKFIPSYQLGGDSFGYHWIDSEHFAFYLLDVSGHGVGPALHSVAVLNMLRFETLPNTDFTMPEQVFKALNRSFQMDEHDDLYFTVWYCVFDITKNVMSYAGAGHPPLILVFDGTNIVIDSNNFLIGYSPDYKYKSGKVVIKKGTSIYLYSDGAYEISRPDGTMMTAKDLREFIMKNKKENGAELILLYEDLIKKSKKESLDDDFVILRIDIN